jgi:hypothetical protein
MSDTELLDQSFNIAWSVLLRSGEIGDPDVSANFLFREIISMMEKGERRRLMLSNMAIDLYRLRFPNLDSASISRSMDEPNLAS